MRASWFIVTATFTVLTGCVEVTPFEPTAFEPLVDASDSGFRDSEPTVRWVTNHEDWDAFWDTLEGDASEPPEVDFDRRIVIGAFLGQRSSGGYAVEVRSVAHADRGVDVFEVVYVELTPGDECGVTTAITYPYQLVTVSSDAESQADVDVMLFNGGDETSPCG